MQPLAARRFFPATRPLLEAPERLGFLFVATCSNPQKEYESKLLNAYYSYV